MQSETDLMVLEVPILEDDTVTALHDFLLDLVTQFENHYGHQLRRQWQKLDAETRDLREPWRRITPASFEEDHELDEDSNYQLPF